MLLEVAAYDINTYVAGTSFYLISWLLTYLHCHSTYLIALCRVFNKCAFTLSVLKPVEGSPHFSCLLRNSVCVPQVELHLADTLKFLSRDVPVASVTPSSCPLPRKKLQGTSAKTVGWSSSPRKMTESSVIFLSPLLMRTGTKCLLGEG